MQCAGTANRKRGGAKPRPCAQQGVFHTQGQWWCWYHNPDDPKKFGEGYVLTRAKGIQ